MYSSTLLYETVSQHYNPLYDSVIPFWPDKSSPNTQNGNHWQKTRNSISVALGDTVKPLIYVLNFIGYGHSVLLFSVLSGFAAGHNETAITH